MEMINGGLCGAQTCGLCQTEESRRERVVDTELSEELLEDIVQKYARYLSGQLGWISLLIFLILIALIYPAFKPR